MKNAIVCLTRGYEDLYKYDDLIKRNQCIRQFINVDLKYPLIIFHEGNITEKAQAHIISKSEGQQIHFVDVSEIWEGGYESMCQFQTIHLWNYCKGYDYVLRIDEDCFITKCEKDPFEMIGDFVYLKSAYWAESHSETNETLPKKIEEVTGAKQEDFYNHKFPYTNISLAKVSFWTDEKMFRILYMIAMCPDQRKNRWGDLPVLGSLLNIFANGWVGDLKGMSYFHGTHNNTIDC